MMPNDILWCAKDFDPKTETFRHNAECPDISHLNGKEKSWVNDILTG